jgi:molecular chaperone Hsp33
MTEDNAADRSLRFLFEEADIRGESVRLQLAYRDVTSIHQYPPGVSRMLGEFMAAGVLLASTLKFEGKLVLQARSEGQIPLIMVECDENLNLRAIARGAQEATATGFDQLLGGGQLAITIDPLGGQRYQGIVPLSGETLAQCLDEYFRQSEQLQTRLWLAADGARAAGLLLQQLPAEVTSDAEHADMQWENACALATTVSNAELLDLTAENLLYRLYHEHEVRLFEPAGVRFRCNCSRERTLRALSALNPAEIEDLLEELGSITMDCEFCNAQYRFTRDDLLDILPGTQSKTLH